MTTISRDSAACAVSSPAVARPRCTSPLSLLALAALLLAAALGPAAASAAPATTSVVNGEAAEHGSFPYLAFVYYREGGMAQACTGTVVSSNVILTAAHCVVDEEHGVLRSPAGFKVVTGNVELGASERVVSNVSSLAVHPEYAWSGDYAHWADAALLQLSQPIAAPAVKLATSEAWVAGGPALMVGSGEGISRRRRALRSPPLRHHVRPVGLLLRLQSRPLPRQRPTLRTRRRRPRELGLQRRQRRAAAGRRPRHRERTARDRDRLVHRQRRLLAGESAVLHPRRPGRSLGRLAGRARGTAPAARAERRPDGAGRDRAPRPAPAWRRRRQGLRQVGARAGVRHPLSTAWHLPGRLRSGRSDQAQLRGQLGRGSLPLLRLGDGLLRARSEPGGVALRLSGQTHRLRLRSAPLPLAALPRLRLPAPVAQACGRPAEIASGCRCSWTKRTTVAPSPIAVAQRLIEPERTSPAA
jgi:hypothetical protein